MLQYYYARLYSYNGNHAATINKIGILLDYFLFATDLTLQEIEKFLIKHFNLIEDEVNFKEQKGLYIDITTISEKVYEDYTSTIHIQCDREDCNLHNIGFDVLKKDLITYNNKSYCSYVCLREDNFKFSTPLVVKNDPYRYAPSGRKRVTYYYHVYDKKTNCHHVGMTHTAPFFLWAKNFSDKEQPLELTECEF